MKLATGIFQTALAKQLKGLKNTVVGVDDVLIRGRDDRSTIENIEVFVALKENGLKLNQEKCLFLRDEICYLSYKINKCDLNPIPEELDAILIAPTPKNVTKLKAFLGMLNYYYKTLNR